MHWCVQCGGDVAPRRADLGYLTCLTCGDREARSVRHTVVPMNKSNYTVITNLTELAQLNPKGVR